MTARTLLRRRPRRGSTLVEAALVLSVFLMLLFGMFEYCRFLMVLHVTNNAARDGARYAAVNVSTPSGQVANKKQEIIDYTKARMGGIDNMIGANVTIYPCDNSGFTQNPPQVIPKSGNPDWNDVSFPERLAVTIDGTYTPVTPLLLFMPSSIPINVTAVMGSEG